MEAPSRPVTPPVNDSTPAAEYSPQSPTTIPAPTITQTGNLTIGGRTVTSITRRWERGQAELCRLCPDGDCTAFRGICTVLVPLDVPSAEAPLFSTRGLDLRVDPFVLLSPGAYRSTQ